MNWWTDFLPSSRTRNGHLQTIGGNFLLSTRRPYRAVPHRVLLPDGDVLMLHDDRPEGWQPASPSAILLHGLTGTHQSSYMAQAAGRLNDAGVRTFRMDMRACGASEGLARMPYHAGISQDLLAALESVVEICPASPISIVGFSVGGNTALKLAGEAADHLPPQLSRPVAICPPIDLGVCVDGFSNGAARYYDSYIANSHYRHLLRSAALVEHAPHVANAFRPRGQPDFDSWYTAAMWGFESVDEFYADTSSCRVIPDIRVPTLVIASRDDPLVPVRLFENLEVPNSIPLHVTDHGGHLEFISRSGIDSDRRWMDWRIVDYVTAGRSRPAAKAV